MWFSRESKGKYFDKHECWEAVSQHRTFKDPPSTPPRPTFSSPEIDSSVNLDDDEVLETPPSPSSRPMGIKKAKEARRKGKNKQEKDDRVAIAVESIAQSNYATIELIKKRDENTRNHVARVLALEELKEDARIMSKDTTEMSPESKEWWKRRKAMVKGKTLFGAGSSVN